MKKRTKIVITSLSLAALLFTYYNIDYKYQPKYEIVGYVNSIKPYARYSLGDVYIIKDKKLINEITLSTNDVIIIDERDDDNPNMHIMSSCNITDKNARNEIIEIIQEYNREYPSNWKRTNVSLRLEWYVHNLLYDLDYKLDHTTDVDLDNKDEDYFNKPFFNHLIKI